MKKWNVADRGKLITALILLIIFGQLMLQAVYDIGTGKDALRQGWHENLAQHCLTIYQPFLDYIDMDTEADLWQEKVLGLIAESLPAYTCMIRGQQEAYVQSRPFWESIRTEEEIAVWQTSVEAENQTQEAIQSAVIAENQEAVPAPQPVENIANATEQSTEATLQEPQQVPPQTAVTGNGFVPATVKTAEYARMQLENPDFIKEAFYTEDPTTQIKQEYLSYQNLMGYDASLQQDASLPQILIYHTHSQETFVDSNPQDPSTTIVGVGEYLSTLLREQYGFHVLHHMGQYDVESRDYAYSKAAAGIEEVLAQNPSIEVMIDLHRDEMREDVKLVTNIQGLDMAKFMFFNGLSYTRERGEITTLPNPYIQENLALAFQMKLMAEEYYPGLTRKTYLKGYRYNLHYRPKSMLIELGAQTNTVQEAKNSCLPLAHIIAMVLSE